MNGGIEREFHDLRVLGPLIYREVSCNISAIISCVVHPMSVGGRALSVRDYYL
jgi:hypothetical protein